jgi:exodeoxyribonuclease VII small subunit
VANPPKSTGAPKPAIAFEDALSKLEGIVESMETDELPLEQLLAKYEDGVRLAKVCQEKLSDAELKIQQLEKTAGGELKLKPLSLEPTGD